MTANELRTQSTESLKNQLKEFRESLFNLKFRHVLGQLEDSSQMKKARKDIARIQTILRARELELES